MGVSARWGVGGPCPAVCLGVKTGKQAPAVGGPQAGEGAPEVSGVSLAWVGCHGEGFWGPRPLSSVAETRVSLDPMTPGMCIGAFVCARVYIRARVCFMHAHIHVCMCVVGC